ncbi:MAG TPA: ABC transporter ATP-binding protein [bacterium]|jgi:putative ABC transport system ATP-binding protein|nr:ABC transporter ATP-binding protein [bacterium]HNZ51092.1 ABC transporter ATP-binding protein [bacterium]HOF79852.1 ABC transporter ATP-binding protein [bacterium]HOH85360.1 ABC transporter ATP-binding protein [bacterium]HOQ91653.1 ABC transporter ATP-binding protein [bacterium]
MIELKKINKIYQLGDNETQVLKDISLKISDGEFVAITGPSGSGKSTIMHIIGALDTPTSGTYLLDGQDVSALSDDDLADIRKNKIGFVFQSFNLLSRATVLRNVALPLIYAEIPLEKRQAMVEAALRACGLAQDRWHHLSNQLSGGQMQRVAIARALVNNPSIILADEPTGNLDSKTGQVVLETFKKLNQDSGHTIILITHELEVAKQADRIIYIRDGQIVGEI